ncbi:hypothetical protein AGOR_G00094080 [Albula goreensis]|uniref:VWFA domain-containing protein n=1 Tax=Albula goreensis TaxID=1534307 RepID=A0A8T3DFX2_9TELE|nr:hypothetical protein AGOR_G00094080 [Albula goreensis]
MQSGSGLRVAVLCLTALMCVSSLHLHNNGYEDLLVAIHPRVPEDHDLIQSIQDMFREASPFLFKATRRRAFFRNIQILVPVTWSQNNTLYQRPTAADTYKKAQVVISDPFCQSRASSPYTVTSGLCGQPGHYIHLTPQYLLDQQVGDRYGPKGRVLVHSWATLRWGVFSEFDSHTPFYRSNMGQLEATRCSKFVEGTLLDRETGGKCQISPDTGLPTEACVFQVTETLNTTASIMYQHFIPEISEFCDDSSHNFEAPNAQNRLCDYRSVWDVIRQSSDFSHGANPPLPTQPEAPSFTLLRARHRVVCLVLDVSGSMSGSNRIDRQRQAAEVFLEQIVNEGSKVGLVSFSGSKSILAGLTEVTGPSSREQLASKLPAVAGGTTDICEGLRGGFEVLEQDDGKLAGDEIILLTDGEDSQARNCIEEVGRSGVIVHTIALGPNADSALEQFANSTGGQQFFASDSVNSNGLIDVFSDVTSQSGDDTRIPIQLLSASYHVANGHAVQGTVSIDASVGNNTVFTFTWQSNLPEFLVQDPSSYIYNNSQLEIKANLKTARLRVPGMAQPGTWSFSLVNTNAAQTLTVTVSSYAVDECIPPVKVTPFSDSTSVAYPKPVTVTATVSQGDRAVLGADVFAIMENANSPVKLQLLDDGVGADVTKNDGVYSAYFYNYVNGRYSIKVVVEGAGGSVTVKTDVTGSTISIRSSYIDINGTLHPGAPPGSMVNESTSPIGNLSRSISGGSITVSYVPQTPNFPPGRVTDLAASLTNESQSNQSLALDWTAPGEDYYFGTVSGYDIRFSLNPSSLRENFNSTAILNASFSSLHSAGERETVLFSINDVFPEEGVTVLYFALRAWDNEDSLSEISNIAQVSIFIYHPALPPSPSPERPPSPPPRPASLSQRLSLILPLAIVLPVCLLASCCILAALCCRRRRRRKSHPLVGLGYPNVMVMDKIS